MSLSLESRDKNAEQSHLAQIQEWVKTQTSYMQNLLEDIRYGVLLRGEHIDENGKEDTRIYNPDPFSLPFCHKLVHKFPSELLPYGIQKNPYLTRRIGLSTGQATEWIEHSDFSAGVVHIDATIGQFFPGRFDAIVKSHSNLFIGHILVATEYDLKHSMNIQYMAKHQIDS